MSINGLPSDLPIVPFNNAEEFESFLDREHLTSPGIYLKLAKKSSGLPSVTSAEAIEVALCFGWINGQGKPFDNQWCLSRYTPRRPKSMWSQRNVGIVAELVEAGRMRPAGLAAVDSAKADGRWVRAYDTPTAIQVPEDFAAVLARDHAAAAFFARLNKTCRYAVLWRVQTASPQNRAKRIDTLVKTLAEGKVPGRPEGVTKPRSKASVKEAATRAVVQAGAKVRKPGRSSRSRHDDQTRSSRRTGLRPRS